MKANDSLGGIKFPGGSPFEVFLDRMEKSPTRDIRSATIGLKAMTVFPSPSSVNTVVTFIRAVGREAQAHGIDVTFLGTSRIAIMAIRRLFADTSHPSTNREPIALEVTFHILVKLGWIQRNTNDPHGLVFPRLDDATEEWFSDQRYATDMWDDADTHEEMTKILTSRDLVTPGVDTSLLDEIFAG